MADSGDIAVEVDPDTLAFKVFDIRTVAETIADEANEMTLEEAIKLNPAVKIGNRLKIPTEPQNFGRIAAQTAKQVIIQKIRDAERDNIFDEFKDRAGEVVTGIVKRNAHGNVTVMIGHAEAILPYREQSPREILKPGDRLRAYLLEVENSSRGAQLVLSRTSTELVRSLFEQEVPELFDGTVEIMAIAREPGSRTKVAVRSSDSNVDPVGACVGMKGSRVRAVVEELSGEKIDIVRWSDNVIELCASALNPADIVDIQPDESTNCIKVTVPQDQLSLAIGKRGQNARLASKLIGWSIDIAGDGNEESPDETKATEKTTGNDDNDPKSNDSETAELAKQENDPNADEESKTDSGELPPANETSDKADDAEKLDDTPETAEAQQN